MHHQTEFVQQQPAVPTKVEMEEMTSFDSAFDEFYPSTVLPPHNQQQPLPPVLLLQSLRRIPHGHASPPGSEGEAAALSPDMYSHGGQHDHMHGGLPTPGEDDGVTAFYQMPDQHQQQYQYVDEAAQSQHLLMSCQPLAIDAYAHAGANTVYTPTADFSALAATAAHTFEQISPGKHIAGTWTAFVSLTFPSVIDCEIAFVT